MKSIQTMTFYFLIKICFKNDFFFVVVVVLTDVIHSCIHLFIYFWICYFGLKEHHCAGTERTVQQSVESVRLNAAWLARDAQAVGEYLGSKSLPL